jgi:hypothetical protein
VPSVTKPPLVKLDIPGNTWATGKWKLFD